MYCHYLQQQYLLLQNNRHSRAIGEPEVDLHVVQVYREFKLSGKGIRVVVLDDGLEYTHPDISLNYVRPYGFVLQFKTV
jgi:hypothetical protein